MRFLMHIASVCLVFSLIGCASIVSDSTYPVSLSSTPSKADITIKDDNGKTIYSGKTPTTVTLDSSSGFFQPAEYTVKCEKDGHSVTRSVVKGELDGWYIGNIAFGGLIGWLIVDPATGAMWKLEDMHMNLSDNDTASAKDSLQIMTLEQVPEDLRSNLVKLN